MLASAIIKRLTAFMLIIKNSKSSLYLLFNIVYLKKKC